MKINFLTFVPETFMYEGLKMINDSEKYWIWIFKLMSTNLWNSPYELCDIWPHEPLYSSDHCHLSIHYAYINICQVWGKHGSTVQDFSYKGLISCISWPLWPLTCVPVTLEIHQIIVTILYMHMPSLKITCSAMQELSPERSILMYNLTSVTFDLWPHYP